LATSPLRLMTSNFIFQQNTCRYSPYVTTCLTRGWVCRLQLLLVLASTVILRSESRGTHDHILLSQIQTPPTWRPGPRIYIPQEQDGPIVPPDSFSFLFVASYDSQGYRGGLRPRLHTPTHSPIDPALKHFDMDRVENTVPLLQRNCCVCVSWRGRCLETAVV
jgi:hypothetical protein